MVFVLPACHTDDDDVTNVDQRYDPFVATLGGPVDLDHFHNLLRVRGLANLPSWIVVAGPDSEIF